MRQLSFVAVLLLSLAAPSIWADTLFIGNGATGSCPKGEMPPCSNDPVFINTANNISMYLNNGGSSNYPAPVLLILSIPNYAGGPLPVISSVDKYPNFVPGGSHSTVAGPISPGGPLQYGGVWNAATGAGPINLDPTHGDVYDNLSLVGADNSNNWTNYSGAYLSKFGVLPSSFSLFVYEINTPLSSKDLLDVKFAGSGLTPGTLAVGYVCSALTSAGECYKGLQSQGSPFTRAGMATPVPEPSAMVVLSAGLAGLMVLRRRRNT